MTRDAKPSPGAVCSSTEKIPSKSEETKVDLSRRGFLGGVGSLAVTSAALGGIGAVATPSVVAAGHGGGSNVNRQPFRRNVAFRKRFNAAKYQRNQPLPGLPRNGDEGRYSDLRGSFSKALPHDALGEVQKSAFNKLKRAIRTGRNSDFDAIPLGGVRRLANPQAALAFGMIGADSHHLDMIAPPAFDSAWEASEMAEVYWQAITRDVPFADYGSDPLIADAVADLNAFSDFRGPKQGGAVTPDTLFRGTTTGDLTGPYLSQFLWQDIPYGGRVLDQRYSTPVAGDDHMVTYADWLAIQRGAAPATSIQFDPTTRYLRDGRGMGEYVHTDFTYQAYQNAALILLSYGGSALSPTNPYRTSITNQGAFVTLGAANVLELVAKVSGNALKAAWFHKWGVHRRLRPEVFAGRIHNQITGAKNYGVNPEILASSALTEVFNANGNYLLPMAYSEGSPTHPAYPAGHATIAGACVTILKAFFDNGFVIPNPVEANAAGDQLLPYGGPTLTIGNELDKLATNISLGRDTAGVHWRTDGSEGLLLGEQVAILLLHDVKRTYTEQGFTDFEFTAFDGSTVQF